MTSGSLFIIAFNPEDVASLSALASDMGHSGAPIAAGSLSDAVKALNAFGKTPDFLIIDIGSRAKDVLGDLDEIAVHCEPTVSVVVIGTINDIQFYRELKKRGILEYFPRPVEARDVNTAFAQASMAQKSGPSGSAHGTVISCMSAASGDGASTLAVNLSYCLATEHNLSTVLVDMDYQFGLVAKSLDLTAPFGIRELFENPDRGLDDTLVEKMLVKYGEKFKVISAPNELRMLPQIGPEFIHNFINILRDKFKFVILDVPNLWTPWTAASLKYSDHTLLVAQLWLRSLTHTTRQLTAWHSAGIDRNKVSLYINRSGAKFKEAVSAEDFERICHHTIEAHMNNDIKAVINAETQGKTIFETGQGALLQQQIKQIAGSLAARFQGEKKSESTPESAGKRGLKGLFDKKAGQ
jgi:pilus assembly protein CpaE